MKKVLILLLSALVLFGAKVPHLTQIKSKYGYYTTIKRIKLAIRKKKLRIFCAIDHYRNAKRIKRRIEPSYLILFGTPYVGSHLMKMDVRAGLDLPMRILIFRLRGRTYVIYHRPIEMLEYYHLPRRTLQRMDKTLRSIVRYGCGR